MVRSGNHETVGAVLLDHLQKAVEDAPESHPRRLPAPAASRWRRTRRREYTPLVRRVASKICRSFAAVSPMYFVMSASSRTSKRGRPNSPARTEAVSVFPGTGRTRQQQLAARREPPLHDAAGMTLLPNDTPNLIVKIRSKDHLSEPRLRIRRFQQARQLAARPPDRNRPSRPRPVLRGIDHGAQLFREPAMPTPRLMRGHLHGDGEKAVVVAVNVRLEQRLELFTASHTNPNYPCTPKQLPRSCYHPNAAASAPTRPRNLRATSSSSSTRTSTARSYALLFCSIKQSAYHIKDSAFPQWIPCHEII